LVIVLKTFRGFGATAPLNSPLLVFLLYILWITHTL